MNYLTLLMLLGVGIAAYGVLYYKWFISYLEYHRDEFYEPQELHLYLWQGFLFFAFFAMIFIGIVNIDLITTLFSKESIVLPIIFSIFLNYINILIIDIIVPHQDKMMHRVGVQTASYWLSVFLSVAFIFLLY